MLLKWWCFYVIIIIWFLWSGLKFPKIQKKRKATHGEFMYIVTNQYNQNINFDLLISKSSQGTSLSVWWLRLHASNGGCAFHPGWATKVPHAFQHSQKNQKKTKKTKTKTTSPEYSIPNRGHPFQHLWVVPLLVPSQISPVSRQMLNQGPLYFWEITSFE